MEVPELVTKNIRIPLHPGYYKLPTTIIITPITKKPKPYSIKYNDFHPVAPSRKTLIMRKKGKNVVKIMHVIGEIIGVEDYYIVTEYKTEINEIDFNNYLMSKKEETNPIACYPFFECRYPLINNKKAFYTEYYEIPVFYNGVYLNFKQKENIETVYAPGLGTIISAEPERIEFTHGVVKNVKNQTIIKWKHDPSYIKKYYSMEGVSVY